MWGGSIRLKNHSYTLKTPSDEEIEKTFSYGFEGFYRYRLFDHLVLNLNAGFFFNNIQYKASNDSSSLAADGSINTASSVGKWLGFKVQGLF